MTKKQSSLLTHYVRQIANQYQSPAVIGLDAALQIEFEENESDQDELLAVKMADLILGSHFIGLAPGQVVEFQKEWLNIIKKLKGKENDVQEQEKVQTR